ncbi:MAG TPA: YfdX family protein [Rhizobiales bacterium]|nr:YfdX family protein [Hyphomicrobiales bacterium]
MLKYKTLSRMAPVFLAASLLAIQPVMAGGTTPQKSKTVTDPDKAATLVGKKIDAKTAAANAVKKTADNMTKSQKKAIKSAVSALLSTQKAIVMLDKKDAKKAMENLEKAVGKIEVVLALSPDLSLAPINISSEIVDMKKDVKGVKKARDEAVKLLREGRVQDARLLLSGLASEAVIHVSSIPLATYPQAIKKAIPLIEKGKLKEAKEALLLAVGTVVVEDTVIPLPVVRADDYLLRAEKLAEKVDRSPKEGKQLSALLKAAHGELEFAEVLGYGKADDFKGFYEQIAEITKKTRNGKHGNGFFDKIKKDLSGLMKHL